MEENDLIVSDVIKKDLQTISSWLKFFGILGFVGVGLMVLTAIVFLFFKVILTSTFDESKLFLFPLDIIGLIYLIISIIYFFPTYFIFRSGLDLANAIKTINQDRLEKGINFLKKHFVYMGIIVIIFVSIYILVVIGALMIGMIGSLAS